MKEIINRLHQLVLKCLAVKFLIGVVLPTVLLFLKQIDQNAWWIAVAATIFARAYEKSSTKPQL